MILTNKKKLLAELGYLLTQKMEAILLKKRKKVVKKRKK